MAARTILAIVLNLLLLVGACGGIEPLCDPIRFASSAKLRVIAAVARIDNVSLVTHLNG